MNMNKQIEVESTLVSRWGKNRTNMDVYKVVRKADRVVWIQKLGEMQLEEHLDREEFRVLKITKTKVLDSDQPVIECSYSEGEVRVAPGIYAYLWEVDLGLLLQGS